MAKSTNKAVILCWVVFTERLAEGLDLMEENSMACTTENDW